MLKIAQMIRTVQIVGVWAALLVPAGQALAWGSTGHRLIGREAVLALPDELPSFLRTAAAADAVGELAREPDRWKDAGAAHDADRNPAHYFDLGDDGTISGGPSIKSLPPTREAYEAALRAAGTNSWKVGYLPYSIVDGSQQLAKDFAYWRADAAGAAKTADPGHRAWLAADGVERQALILRDLGTLAHYVGDGSQPLHVTIHFDGWGPFPNPRDYTQQHVHRPFEGEFVRHNVTADGVRAAMASYRDCKCQIADWTSAYLTATAAEVTSFYDLQKAGAFSPDDARGRAFATQRVAAGASALRDLVVDAWRASGALRVGWPGISVADVEAGEVDPFDSLYGID
jgi:hypothetical protein